MITTGINLQLSDADQQRLAVVRDRLECRSKSEALRRLIRLFYESLTKEADHAAPLR
jgi:hypothetical protein